MQQITKVSISILKVHPRNQEFFDDITGDAYEQFKTSIKEDGIITPLIVAPDMTIVSGHQRYKAAIDLGIKQVPVIIREDLDDEDEQLKKLLATNFGRMKNDPVKQRKVAVQYVELCGLKHGDNQFKRSSDNHKSLTQAEIAQQLGISVPTLNEILAIERKLTPDIKELLDTGIISKTAASKIWTKLLPHEQEELLQELGRDKIKEMTIKETQAYIQKTKRLEQELENEKNKPPQIIDNTDYSTINKLKRQVEINQNSYRALEHEKMRLEKQIKLNGEDAKKYQELKKQIEYLKSEKQDLHRQIESATSISRLVVDIEYLLQNKLAPIKYSRAVFEQLHDNVVVNNLTEVVDRVRKWCDEIDALIPNQIIEMEDTYYESR